MLHILVYEGLLSKFFGNATIVLSLSLCHNNFLFVRYCELYEIWKVFVSILSSTWKLVNMIKNMHLIYSPDVYIRVDLI